MHTIFYLNGLLLHASLRRQKPHQGGWCGSGKQVEGGYRSHRNLGESITTRGSTLGFLWNHFGIICKGLFPGTCGCCNSTTHRLSAEVALAHFELLSAEVASTHFGVSTEVAWVLLGTFLAFPLRSIFVVIFGPSSDRSWFRRHSGHYHFLLFPSNVARRCSSCPHQDGAYRPQPTRSRRIR